MRDHRGKIIGTALAMAMAAGCANGTSQPPPNPPLTPVRVLNPAMRPDLQVNAFLLSNNMMIGCEEMANFQLFAASGSNQPADPTTHFEPPIGGWDGSFHLDMEPQKILGTTASTLKLCGKTHGSHGGTWDLVWRVWRGNGLPLSKGQQPLNMNTLKNVEVTFVNNASYKVVYERTSDSGGKAWAVTAHSATFKGDQANGFSLDVANAQALRIDRLTINEQGGTKAIKLARERGSCAAFRICHDGVDCELPKTPEPCEVRGPSKL